jgi:aspartokinase/homoserine dehydrogenase 1
MHSGDSLLEFNGVLSGSLSLIFGLLDDGMSFSEAVATARDKGFTEPDPREDLSGNDVARKLLIILPVDDLAQAFTTLDDAFAQRISAAAENNRVLRYVGSIRDGHCRVGIQEVDQKHPLYNIRDGENALALLTRYYQPIPIVLRGYGAGNEVTAAGVFGDVLRTLWRPVDQ